MIKFMRKHNKKLLAVFASGLLVVWLGSSALEQMFRPESGNETAGVAFGEEFSRNDLARAHTRVEVLEGLGFPWNRPWQTGRFTLPIEPIDLVTWYLLDLEARHEGMVIPRNEVDGFLKMMPHAGRMLESLRDRRGISIERLKEFIADQMRIMRVGELAARSVKVSRPDIDHYIRDTREKVTVQLAILSASAFTDPNAQPEAAALEKQFYKYRDNLPGAGEHGYGYKWPDRVRVEYLTADVGQIEEALEIPRDEARDYWAKNRKKYTKQVPVATAPSTTRQALASSKSTTAPTTSSKPATRTEVKSFAEALKEVEAEMKKQRAPNLAEKLIRQAANRLLEPWYDLAISEDTGYKSAPRGVDAPDYLEKIAEDARDRNGFKDKPEVLRVVKPDRWLTQRDAGELAGIGKASLEGQQVDEDAPTTFADLAFRVENLYASPKRGALSRGLALFEPFNAPLRDTEAGVAGSFYLFRVVGAQKSHVPQTIAEIKDRLIKDVNELEGYRRAGEAATALLPSAKGKGVVAAVEADKGLAKRLGDKGLVKPEAFARKRSLAQLSIQLGLPLTMCWPIEELGVVEERTTGYFPMRMVAPRFEPEVEKFITTCFGLAPEPGATTKPSDSVGLVEMPVSKQWVMVQFLNIDRVPMDQAEKMRQQAGQVLEMCRAIDFIKAWYSPEQVKKRTAYVDKLAEEDQDKKAEKKEEQGEQG
ncbi:MAG: hypothetical protein JXQ73_05155 [Phycisphaerae bacterium]|nr:hypothetical protein [Phycisphaerae bacterium]